MVLAVDDDETTLEVFRLMLEPEYDVPTTRSGTAALQILRARPVDAVLLDLVMPGMDGLEVLARIKDIDPDLPVILVSGLVQAQAAVTGMRLGAFDYLTKPFAEEELLGVVAEAVRRRRAELPTVLLIGDDPGLLARFAVLLSPYSIVATAPPLPAMLPDPGLRRPLLVVCYCPATAAGAQIAEQLAGRYPGSSRVLLASTGHRAGPPHVPCGIGLLPDRLDEVLQYVAALVPAFPGLADRATRMGRHLRRLLDVMACSYPEPLATGDLARAVGCSAHHLAHIVRNRLDMSPRRLLTGFRFEVARHLLAFTDASLDGVAHDAGFSSASHLSRVFLQRTARRPGDYRRQVRLGGFWPPRHAPGRFRRDG